MRRPHFIILGGFLGAGKTTAIRRLVDHLSNQGIRSAVITNDQGTALVDTQLLRNCGVTVGEVTGGCFCCRFDELLNAAHFLTSDVGPEVLIAEPVGSCTDLIATVTRPLLRLFADRYTMAPLSVVVDPIRARQVLRLDAGAGFSGDIEYIYLKQLEEAELIVMNKCDLLADDLVNELGTVLSERFPRAEVLAVSAWNGLQLTDWFSRILGGAPTTRKHVDVDYEIYAVGEARLGWVNARVNATGAVPFDAEVLLAEFARALQGDLLASGITMAHLKVSLAPRDGVGEAVAAVQVVHNEAVLAPGLPSVAPLSDATMLVNLRAEASPALLEGALRTAIDGVGGPGRDLTLTLAEISAFSPGAPRPTHRDRA